jgi:hypothetical protein
VSWAIFTIWTSESIHTRFTRALTWHFITVLQLTVRSQFATRTSLASLRIIKLKVIMEVFTCITVFSVHVVFAGTFDLKQKWNIMHFKDPNFSSSYLSWSSYRQRRIASRQKSCNRFDSRNMTVAFFAIWESEKSNSTFIAFFPIKTSSTLTLSRRWTTKCAQRTMAVTITR